MQKIGLVLSGGGTNGFAHIGALKVLDSLNIKFRAIAGCSIGSIIGACYAAGKTPLDIEEFVTKRKLHHFLNFSISRLGISKTDKLKKSLEKFMSVKSFEELKIPLFINATNLSTGKEVVFSSGELFRAIRASIAVPGIFAPLIIHEDYYVDGGVLDNAPFSILPKKIKKYVIINVDPYEPLKKGKPPSLSKLLETSGRAAMEELIRLRLKTIAKRNYVLIEPPVPGYKLLPGKEECEKIIMAGESATIKKIFEIRKKFNLNIQA